jgi:lipid-A-disaccharide synthase
VLNQHVARAARRRGIPVLYYIAPQVWASRPWRARELARVADLVACILPFEEAYLRARGIRAEFVGHPLFETAAPVTMECGTKAATGASTDLSTNSVQSSEAPRIAILPGSRRQVIEALLPRQLAVVELLRQGGLPATAQISCVSEDRLARMHALCADAAVPAEIVVGDPAAVVRGADLILVASGTATLDVARHLKPMLVLYDAGRLLAGPYRWFGRYFLTTPHLSLVNILAGKRVVPEFMPFISEIEPIAEVARQLLRDETWRRLMCRQLAETIRPLSDSRASLRVCEVIRSMLAA